MFESPAAELKIKKLAEVAYSLYIVGKSFSVMYCLLYVATATQNVYFSWRRSQWLTTLQSVLVMSDFKIYLLHHKLKNIDSPLGLRMWTIFQSCVSLRIKTGACTSLVRIFDSAACWVFLKVAHNYAHFYALRYYFRPLERAHSNCGGHWIRT